MPKLPRILPPTGQLPVYEPRINPYGVIARGLEDVSESLTVFQRIQDAADRSDARMLFQQAKTNIDGTLKLNNQQIVDPDEFQTTTQVQLQDITKSTLESAGPRVRSQLEGPLRNKLEEALFDLKFDTHKKRIDKVLADFSTEEQSLIEQAASQDQTTREDAYRQYGARIGELKSKGFLTNETYQKRMTDFHVKALGRDWNLSLEADPSTALRKLNSGYYNAIDPLGDRQRIMRGQANNAISSALTVQKRDQQEKQEAADRELQGMIDKNVPSDVIQNRLMELSAAGVLDRNDRKFWDDKLLRGEKADSAQQTDNAEKLRSKFLDSYPTFSRIAEYRALKRQMERSGELGDKGASIIGNMLIMAERSLQSEGRAQRAESRALERQNEPRKMTAAQGEALIRKNFPNDFGNYKSKPNQEDQQEYNQRARINGEDPDTVAKEIYTRRQKIQQQQKAQIEAAAKAAKENPVAKSILDDLNALKDKR